MPRLVFSRAVLPPLDARIKLRLAETRTFPSGVVYVRYQLGQ